MICILLSFLESLRYVLITLTGVPNSLAQNFQKTDWNFSQASVPGRPDPSGCRPGKLAVGPGRPETQGCRPSQLAFGQSFCI